MSSNTNQTESLDLTLQNLTLEDTTVKDLLTSEDLHLNMKNLTLEDPKKVEGVAETAANPDEANMNAGPTSPCGGCGTMISQFQREYSLWGEEENKDKSGLCEACLKMVMGW